MKTEYKSDENPAENVRSQIAAQECPTSLEDDDVRRPLVKKTCKECLELKAISDFYFNRTKNTIFSECKECNKKRSSRWNKVNRRRYQDNCSRHKMQNPELYKSYKVKEYYKNKLKYSEYGKKYRKSKIGRETRNALERVRQLGKKKACPSWLSKEHKLEMKLFYINRPEGMHVDHVVPLNGKIVSGLHVPWNLQYLPAAENSKKRNKF